MNAKSDLLGEKMKKTGNNDQLLKLIFKTAFCAMTCDGNIDEREIQEIRKIHDKSPVFKNVDINEELKLTIDKFKNDNRKVITELLEELDTTDYNSIQELMLLEVALRIINSDEKIEENEVKFINILRSKLKVHNQTIINRFGKVKILELSSELPVQNDDRIREFISNIPNADTSVLQEYISKRK